MTESIRKEDWERFRAIGRVPPSIREIVLQSWRRSESLGGVSGLKRAPCVGEEALARRRRENRNLRRAARPALDHSGYLLKDAGAMLLLCDREGVVMDMAGDPGVLERGRENHLAEGGRWDEAAIGTNAIGAALHARRAVEISGVEHFAEEIQRWTCAAAPILHPATGDVLGVIDVSGPVESGQPHGLAFSSTLALQMEEALRHEMESERRRLLEGLLRRRSLWREDDLILFDRFGAEIYATERFARTASEIGDFEGWRAAAAGWSEGVLNESFREDLAAALPGAQVEVIQEREEEPLGLLIALRRTRTRGPGAEARAAAAGEPDLAWIAGGGPEMAGLCADARRLVRNSRAILIEGETGVGKETLARALHREAAGEAAGSFEVLACGLLSVERLREEAGPRGLAERLARQGGALCLDEPAETPPEAQSALMELLRAVRRTPEAPVWIYTLSTRDLAAEAEGGRIRRELYYRLAGARLTAPPLRARREEIPRLALRFAEEAAARSGDRPLRFTPGALARLKAHDWFGNVRELRNLVESLSSVSLNRLADLRDLPPEIAPPRREASEETLRDREKAEILAMVAAVDGNLTEAAKRLGVARSTLYLKLDSYGFRRAGARR
ncbi:sigma 54-interacting transcriptional regulator [Neomegalonema sp.]|uniref:sigma-54-dependent Fis family transcriptional regulator n=1 Tax=Neomegalonema sp. TaxID=2039713 RepID=UPI00261D54DA|nr:sigma 54-interacting transcriptional regulator [Neomegalonema sp.]MDD2868481.1 sigma 54-interacting transcriptional regulator [Neomegalonema sp.]